MFTNNSSMYLKHILYINPKEFAAFTFTFISLEFLYTSICLYKKKISKNNNPIICLSHFINY